MSSRPITIRLPNSRYNQLEIYTADTATTKSEVVVSALSQYLGINHQVSLSERVARLEQRMAALEGTR